MQKINEYQKKYIIRSLTDLIRWHLETFDNVKEKYLSVRPLTCQMNIMHDLAIYIKNINIEEQEWKDIFIIADMLAHGKDPQEEVKKCLLKD